MYVFAAASLLFVHFFYAFRSLYSSNDDDDNILILVNIKITQCLVYLCCIIYTKQYYFYDIEMYIYVYLQVSPLCFLSM